MFQICMKMMNHNCEFGFYLLKQDMNKDEENKFMDLNKDEEM